MDIVDSQVHLNRFGSEWRNTAPDVIVNYAVAATDALGIDGIVIDEWAGFDAQHRHLPGAVLPNGAMRGHYPFSQQAVDLYPDRFAYMASRRSHSDSNNVMPAPEKPQDIGH